MTWPTRGRSPRTRPTAQAAQERTGTRCRPMPSRSTSTVARPCSPSKKQVAGTPARGCRRLDEAVQPGAQDADQPLGLVQLLVRLGLHPLARGAADARARGGHDVERALMLARRVLVVALGDRLGQLGQLAGHAAAAGDQQLAAVGDVAEADVRAPAAAAHAQQQEDEHGGSHRDDQPDRAPPPEPGPAAAEAGRAAAASRAAHSAAARGARVRGVLGIDLWVVTVVASAPREVRLSSG